MNNKLGTTNLSMEVCSSLVHKFPANVCSIPKSSETNPRLHGEIADNEKVKNEEEEEERKEEEKNELIASSDISTTNNEQFDTTMGQEISKNKPKKSKFTELTDRQVELLVSSTNFSAQQVREWHQSFLHDCPSGKLDRKHFVDVYRQFYPHGKANHFCSLAFKAFDRDKNGYIDFNEFLSAIALTMSGELRDRLDLAFSIYDINGDGTLDKKELAQIIKLVYEVNGKKHIKSDVSPIDKARMIIEKFDIDGDRKLSKEEFIAGCLNSSELRKLLTP